MKIRFKGKLIGVVFCLVLTNNILASLILLFLGHFLFDSKDDVKESEPTIDEVFVCENSNDNSIYIKTIIELSISLLGLKKNILVSELNVLKNFFRTNMGFEYSEIRMINNIITDVIKNKKKIDRDKASNCINQFCRYEEKVEIIHLLFVIAIADMKMTKEEYDFIFDIGKRFEIKMVDFNKLREIYTTEILDIYEILGVDKEASLTDIKKAYRRLVSQHHPDKNKDDYDNEKFQKIVNAYNELIELKKSK